MEILRKRWKGYRRSAISMSVFIDTSGKTFISDARWDEFAESRYIDRVTIPLPQPESTILAALYSCI